MDVTQLIVLVRQRPVLYDQQSADYHNPANRRKAWNEVARLMDESEDDCRYRWSSLRSMYNRYLQNMESKKNPNWQHAQQLDFLKPYLRRYRGQPAEPVSSYTDPDQEEKEEEEEKLTVGARKPTPRRLPVLARRLTRTPSTEPDLPPAVSDKPHHHSDAGKRPPHELQVLALLIGLSLIITTVVVAWNIYLRQSLQ